MEHVSARMSGLPPHLQPLLSPQSYPHSVASVRLVETHISWVLLTGKYAYKIKRPVHYPFVDLRSAEHRAFLCAEEVRLNRRFAPQLYLDVCGIVESNSGVRIADDGAAIEHAVRMLQFDREEELDRLIEAGRVAASELEEFGRVLAAIHAQLPQAAPGESWGTVASVRTQLETNLAQCRQSATDPGTRAAVDALARPLDALLRTLEPDIARRREQGRVRECHGDLHCRNLVRIRNRLVAFDCLEFEPAFRWIDVADEVAFLWMDLAARRRPDFGLAFLSGYLERGGDHELCRLLRLYGTHRALVRAKVAALEHGGARRHHALLDCARGLLEPARPSLVLMSGVSGSGKTWLARQLAPALGAIHLRSDVERKRLAGFAPEADSHSAVAQRLYSADMSARVYARLENCADAVLAGGLPVIVDATFTQRAERDSFRGLAERRGAPLVVVRCTASEDVLRTRITERRERGGDASEADLAVLDWQLAHAEPLAADESVDLLEADTTRADVADQTLEALIRNLPVSSLAAPC